MLLKQTKIVATISDQRCDVDFIKQLFDAGMNVVRMNTAHLGREGAEKLINNVRSVSNRIAILMDTKGPEVRTTVLAEPIPFKAGDRVKVVGNPEQETTRECISVSYPHFVKDLDVDGHILIDDGDLELVVVEKTPDYLLCEVQNEATLGSRKSVNVPGVRINLPSLTEKDRTNILYAIEKDIDFIAHSFVRNKQDILDIKAILDAHNSDIRIIAKIENQEGVDNIDEILEVADGVMVARGDLGIEVPQERIPGIQRVLIRKCILAKKPVIVATQMLHTMISNPRPTRAEVTDIANAIYYRTDALMLSGETAYGKYPVEAVKTMTKVAAQAEKDKLPDNDIRIPLDENSNDVTAFLAKQAVKATTKLKIRAIITDSYSGRTARNLAAFRGKYPVLAICYKEKTMRHLALSYGVEAIYMPELANGQEYYFAALRRLLKEGRLSPTDMVGYLSSGKAGTKTSFLEINVVEDALKHPNWAMGQKITIDSATLVNKGREVMEAKWLFQVDLDQIEVVVQPQSVIHSMVQFVDGAVMAQLGTPDMKLPIQYALYYPDRRYLTGERLDFAKLGQITFEKPDMETFQGLPLALQASRTGGSMPTVFNAANERAVSKFLHREIGFTDIYQIIIESMEHHKVQQQPTVEDILDTEKATYEFIESRW